MIFFEVFICSGQCKSLVVLIGNFFAFVEVPKLNRKKYHYYDEPLVQWYRLVVAFYCNEPSSNPTDT